ncbi:MAG: tetratricopeptide repeat protein [Bacteroidales bacterium]|nr:tetratricopeptide repeat protein [Bacteroidales bacterium]
MNNKLIMGLQINRETIKAFILNELSEEMMSVVANAIIKDKRLAKIYREEKFKIDAKKYYDNKMTPAQRAEFESRLIKDMEAFGKVDQPEETSSSSEELLLKEQLEEAFRNYEASQEQPRINTPSITIIKETFISDRFKYWFAAAASILVLIIVGIAIGYNAQPSDSLENRLYAEYYAPLSNFNDYILANNTFIIAKQKYKDGDYTNALLLLKNLPSYITIEAERNMFIGLSSMEIGRYKVAVDYFEEILTNQSNFDYIPQVRWYLGLCYLKLRDKEKAIETFRTIVNSNDDYSRKAKQILKRIYD